MAKVEIEIGDDGKVGTLPEPMQAWVDRLIKAEHGKAYAKASAEANKAPSPVDLERLKALEEENQRFKVSEAERLQEYQKAREMLEQQHTKRLHEVSTALESERTRARTLAQRTLREQVRAAAMAAGAHPEFLDDFADLVLTRSPIDFDAAHDYAPLLKGESGPAPLDVAAHVKAMLDARPNFRVAPAPGGGARGGAYTSTGAVSGGLDAQLAAAIEAYGKSPTPENMNHYLALQRQAKQAAAKGA